jgi:hypothetical protein
MPAKKRAVNPPIEPSPRTPEVSWRAEQQPDLPDPSAVILPPSGWPRVDSDEVLRRAQAIDTAVSFPYRRKPVASAAQPIPKHSPGSSEPSRPNLMIIHSKPDPRALRWAKPQAPLWVAVDKARQSVRNTWLAVSSRVVQPLTGASERYRAADIPKRVLAARDFALKTAGQIGTGFVSLSNTFGVHVRALLQVSRASVAEAGIQMRKYAAADRARTSNIFSRLRNAGKYEIRIRIHTDAPQFVSSIRDSISAWAASLRSTLQRAGRLWTSMFVAAFSVLLALAVILAIRHHRPEDAGSMPARVSNSRGQSSPSASPLSTNAVSRPAEATKAAGSFPAAGKPAAIPQDDSLDSKTQESASKQHRRVRHNEDEDYVAKDTYKYYGPAGKPSSH